MTLDAPSAALGDLMFGQRCEEAGGGPALPVGAFGEAGPDVLDRRQAQIAEQKCEPGGVDGRSHAEASSTGAVTVSLS